MKILQINAVYGLGSTGRTTAELDQELAKKGIDSVIVTAISNTKKENIYFVGNKLDRKFHGLFSRLFGKQGYFSVRASRKLINYINAEKPDVIHLRNLHANYINVPMLLQFIADKEIPTVITLHDCWLFTGKCCYYTDDKCEKWKFECGHCPALRKWNSSWFFDCSKRMLADKKQYFSAIKKLAVIGVSDWITNEARQSILKNAWKIKRIYNWIDLSVFHSIDTNDIREKLSIDQEFVILGVSQTWSVEKGLLIFIKLAKQMPEKKFVLIGDMPERFEMPENILSVGSISDVHELAKYYDMADVFLNPSIQETFGKTTAEALACGTPVVGYNVTATPELIGNECGIAVDPENDLDHLKAAIYEIESNTKAYYSHNCIEFAEDNFSKEKLIDEYIALYEEIIQ
ncbi:MAG: glycosyltransferase [Oscillospiraceae bacterium]|nr:glycosyltransferase [Oscillospiraceae bacterium]